MEPQLYMAMLNLTFLPPMLQGNIIMPSQQQQHIKQVCLLVCLCVCLYVCLFVCFLHSNTDTYCQIVIWFNQQLIKVVLRIEHHKVLSLNWFWSRFELQTILEWWSYSPSFKNWPSLTEREDVLSELLSKIYLHLFYRRYTLKSCQ